MLNIQFIRQNPDILREALTRRNDNAPLDEILRLDSEHRTLLQEIEGLRARRNKVSKELGRMKEKPPELIADMRQVGESIKSLEHQETSLSERLNDMLLRIPNIPLPSVPLGKGEGDNIMIRSWGEPRRFDFNPKPHWELGEALGIIDFQRGVKLSGSRFYLLKR